MRNPYAPTRPVPRFAVWELTYACNMRCRHCGSNAGGVRNLRPQELTTAEALDLADQLAALGNERITLSGGELFLRRDWDQIAARLIANSVGVGLISNGFLLQRNLARLSALPGLEVVALSLDGTRATHDYIRRVHGSFDRVIAGFRELHQRGLFTAAITSVSKRNIDELDAVHDILVAAGVRGWQLQLVIGEGRIVHTPDLPDLEDLERLVRFIARRRKRSPLRIDAGDNIGYCTPLAEQALAEPWRGCYAGLLVVGIEANGNIKGCLSQHPELMQDNPFVAGNVRQRPLAEIWADDEGFAYNRRFDRRRVQGACRACPHLRECRCGCTATAYALHQTKYRTSMCLYQLGRSR